MPNCTFLFIPTSRVACDYVRVVWGRKEQTLRQRPAWRDLQSRPIPEERSHLAAVLSIVLNEHWAAWLWRLRMGPSWTFFPELRMEAVIERFRRLHPDVAQVVKHPKSLTALKIFSPSLKHRRNLLTPAAKSPWQLKYEILSWITFSIQDIWCFGRVKSLHRAKHIFLCIFPCIVHCTISPVIYCSIYTCVQLFIMHIKEVWKDTVDRESYFCSGYTSDGYHLHRWKNVSTTSTATVMDIFQWWNLLR